MTHCTEKDTWPGGLGDFPQPQSWKMKNLPSQSSHLSPLCVDLSPIPWSDPIPDPTPPPLPQVPEIQSTN